MDGTGEVYLRSTPTKDMTPEMGLLIGKALGRTNRTVVLGMDYMKSSRMMRDAIVAGLLSTGAEIIDIGFVPAPVASKMAHLGDCAVYVTEYHEYGYISGYILLDRNGGVFDRASTQAVRDVNKFGASLANAMAVGRVTTLSDCVNDYNRLLIETFGRDTGCSMILDCSCGCCALSAPQVLNIIGSELVTINAQRDREFYTDLNVAISVTELRNLKHFIGNYSGYIGVSLNRIGTQLDLVDEKGKEVPFEILASMVIQYLNPSRIVLPYDIDRTVEEAAMGTLDLGLGMPMPAIDDDEELIVDKSETEVGDWRISYCEPDLGEICKAVYERKADLGICGRCIIYGGEYIAADAIMTSAIISNIARDHNINSISEMVVPYTKMTLEMSIGDISESFHDNLTDILKTHPNWHVSLYRDGWRVDLTEGWATISLSKSESYIARVDTYSRDKAYILGLMDVLRDEVDRASKSA